MKLLVVHGSFSNLGDAAILESVVRRLTNIMPEVEIHVLYRPNMLNFIWTLPHVYKKRAYSLDAVMTNPFNNIPFLWRYSRTWKVLLLKSVGTLFPAGSFLLTDELNAQSERITFKEFCEEFDALHITGGGYLTDVFYNELFQKCCLVHTFSDFNRPVLLTGQQVGPFKTATARKAMARALRKVRFVGLRDSNDSLRFCQEASLESASFDVMGDDSFGLPAADNHLVLDKLNQYGIKENQFIAVNVRIGHYATEMSQHIKKIAGIINRVATFFGVPLLIVPISFNPNDSDIVSGKELAKEIRDAHVFIMEGDEPDPALYKGILGKALGSVGVSYHFCIFSLSQGVPAICIYDGEYYAHKARGLCNFWKDKRLALHLPEVDIETAAQHIIEVFEDYALRKKLYSLGQEAHSTWQRAFDYHVERVYRN